MADLVIELTKRRDGSVVTRFVRPDGSVTWQRKEGPNAAFFAAHDLMHFAVETVAAHRRGFYGLVAEGWNLSDFGTPWPRGRLPADAEPAELLVSFLESERAAGTEWPAAEFNDRVAQFQAERGLPSPTDLDEELLRRIRDTAEELRARWFALPDGEALRLAFPLDET
jgi:hypothetical protein